MNCKYCGAGLPSRGGKCISCGRMIPFDQQKEMKAMLDPRLNEYRNKDTAFYKKETASDGTNIGKIVLLFLGLLAIIILLVLAF